jgi:RimJ/RimL family protein N-acetyltransferase
VCPYSDSHRHKPATSTHTDGPAGTTGPGFITIPGTIRPRGPFDAGHRARVASAEPARPVVPGGEALVATVAVTAPVVACRPVTTGDAEALRAFAAAIRPSDRTFVDEQLLDPDRLSALASDPSATGLVALIDERIAGVGSIRPGRGWARHVGLLRVVVGERDRGRGVGRELVESLLRAAAERDVAKVVIEVMAGHVSGGGLFERLGFVPEATLRDHVRDGGGDYHDLIVLTTWVDEQGRPRLGGEELAG